jgi:hypothetical protein
MVSPPWVATDADQRRRHSASLPALANPCRSDQRLRREDPHVADAAAASQRSGASGRECRSLPPPPSCHLGDDLGGDTSDFRFAGEFADPRLVLGVVGSSIGADMPFMAVVPVALLRCLLRSALFWSHGDARHSVTNRIARSGEKFRRQRMCLIPLSRQMPALAPSVSAQPWGFGSICSWAPPRFSPPSRILRQLAGAPNRQEASVPR